MSGHVLLNGQPAVGATVQFVAVSPTPETSKLRPLGVVGDDGRFQLATYGYGDGAPAGEYHVLVTWPNPDALSEPGEVPADYRRLRKQYGDPQRPQLRAVVEEGDNELSAFELK